MAADQSPAPGVSGRTFHVDCTQGRDSANGRRPGTAWQTLERANRARLRPGDSLLLRRDCRWQGPLRVSWSGTEAAPIAVAAYGEGRRPIVEDSFQNVLVTGDWFVISDLHLRADPPTRDARCDGQPAGLRYGIFVDKGSEHGVIRDILATELYTGVRIAQGASHHRIIDSTFRDNDMKSDVATSDSGAVAIDLQGDHNEVARNRISGSDACSRFFRGRDGSAISVYGGRHNVIHHNLSSQNHDFVELGDPRTADTLIAYNVDRSTLRESKFAVVHGTGSRYGPVLGTRLVHNTAVLTGKRSTALACSYVLTGDELQVMGNILWGEQDAAACTHGFTEADNIYWSSDGRPSVTFEIAPTSRMIDPGLVDVEGGDLRLTPESPAIDAVRPIDIEGFGDVDAAGVPVPQGFAPDIGAYEFTTEPPPSPTPDPLPSLAPTEPPAGGPTEVPTDSAFVATGDPPIAEPTDPAPTPTPRVTPPPQPRPSPGGLGVPPPTGGFGGLDQLIVLVAVLGVGGLLAAIFVARRSPT